MRGLRTNWLLAALALWMTAGCGGGVDQTADLVPVRGKVRLDGQPVAGAYLVFRPEGATKGGGGSGVTDENGLYELRSPDGRMGAPVGNYRVVVSNQVTRMMGEYPPAPATSPQARLALPAEHGDMQRTRLRATVPDGGGTVDFDLTSQP